MQSKLATCEPDVYLLSPVCAEWISKRRLLNAGRSRRAMAKIKYVIFCHKIHENRQGRQTLRRAESNDMGRFLFNAICSRLVYPAMEPLCRAVCGQKHYQHAMHTNRPTLWRGRAMHEMKGKCTVGYINSKTLHIKPDLYSCVKCCT